MRKSFEELKSLAPLPSPAGVGLAVLQLTNDADCSVEDLVSTIQVNPALSGRVLRAANSSLLAGVTSVTNLRDASLRLGFRSISNLALSFSVIAGNREGACVGFDYDRFWTTSLAHAVAAQAYARLLPAMPAGDAFTAALLSRIGQLALATAHPTAYSELLDGGLAPGTAACAVAEQERFQISAEEVTEALLLDWGMPEGFCRASGRHRELSERGANLEPELEALVHVLRVAVLLADYLTAGPEQREASAKALQAADFRVQLGVAELEQLVNGVGSGWNEWGTLLALPTQEIEKAAFEEGARSATGARSAVAAGEPSRVLVVDDDAVSLRLVVHHLQRAGYAVMTAGDGYDGLMAALHHQPHIIVADWMMPKMDGVNLCKTLRRCEAGRKIYFLLLTGREGEDLIIQAFDAGVNDYVAKPFKPRELLARVRAGQRVIELQAQLEREKQTSERHRNELAGMARRLTDMALTDVLTGRANRRHAMEELAKAWANSARTGEPLSLVLIDIDDFKKINDAHGHDAGDASLKQVADLLAKRTRLDDLCARIGGEEFLVICRNTDQEGARVFAERLRQEASAQILRHGEFSGYLTLSAGVATRTDETANLDQLLKCADLALYRAKSAGKNRVVVWRGEHGRAESA